MKALLAGVSIALALLGGTAALHADAKYVKLRVVNKFDFAMGVEVVDYVSKKTETARDEATKGGVLERRAMLNDKGSVDFKFSVLIRDPKGSYYRCMDVKTSAEGQSQLSYDLKMDNTHTCAG